MPYLPPILSAPWMYRQFDHAGGGIQAKANREVLANVRRPAARFRYGEPGFLLPVRLRIGRSK
ncbi:hypothetical protein [Bosea sp. WAO]|uniref:hypothetical protein n=1 Tax=Bosea sp. WAO TaxID=406341 RepID=UPI0012EE4C60|nr:hypothetical protein [Bosea sp. WAO]